MFDHKNFDKYEFKEIPLNRDLYVVDEVYIVEYENSMLKLFERKEYENVGYASYAAARKINDNSIELSWFTNVSDRFHEVSIILPRDQFVACVGCWQYDEKPRIFVKSEWLKHIHLRLYSVFAFVDAIDMEDALKSGKITREKLLELRSRIDSLSEKYPDIAFISFADSLLLKSNWTVGHFESSVKYTYEPEVFIRLASEINDIYQAILNLSTYTIVAQGSNEYYDDQLLHISKNQKHVSLNSLGIPFAQIFKIDNTAKEAFDSGVHPKAELYLDKLYFHSLKFISEFDKSTVPSNTYQPKMMETPSKYYYTTVNDMLTNLESITA